MQRRDDPPHLTPLFDAVAAAPDDDGARQVLADALLERGDARGEFLSLQLLQANGRATPEQLTRAKNLERRHWRTWLAELPGVGVTNAGSPLNDFHRGFLRGCVLTPTGIGHDSPTWRMVERIELADTGEAGELAAPALQHLQVLTGLDGGALEVVLRGPDKPRLRELSVDGAWQEADGGRAEQRQVLALTRFPTLRVLTLALGPQRHHADWLGWLFEAPLLRQLERLCLGVDLAVDIAGLQAQLVRARAEHLKLELLSPGVRLVLDTEWLSVRFDSMAVLSRRAQALRNLAPRFAPFPYRRFDVKVGGRAATGAELAQLGEVFTAHAS